MSPQEIARHRTGGFCACGCGQVGDEIRFVFPSERWPELAAHPDNAVALSSSHGGGRLPSRVARHARLLVSTPAMRNYLWAHYGGR